MPRGGFRPGSGRRCRDGSAPKPAVSQAAKAAAARIDAAESPIEYLRAVMMDPTVDATRRDRAAQALLPYCHARSAGVPTSYRYVAKRDDAAKKAKWAGYGSSWWELLHSESEREEREAELARDPELRAWVEEQVLREADHSPPDPKPTPETKAAADVRMERYLRDDDWFGPDGKSDLSFDPQPRRPPPAPDDE